MVDDTDAYLEATRPEEGVAAEGAEAPTPCGAEGGAAAPTPRGTEGATAAPRGAEVAAAPPPPRGTEGAAAASAGIMRVVVKRLGAVKATVDVEPSFTVQDFMLAFKRGQGIPPDHGCALIFRGQQLEASRALSDCGVQDGSELDFVLAMSSRFAREAGAGPPAPPPVGS